MSSMSPAGVGTSPSIIQQALPSPITPITPAASWASPDDDHEDLLERFVDNLSRGVGTPLRTSTPVPTQGNVVGVEPRCVPRQNMPSTPSGAGSRRISNASGGSGGRRSGRQSGGRRSGGRGGGGDSNGDDDDDDVEDSTPLDRLGPKDVDVGNELTGSSMTSSCNNSWHKSYKIHDKRLQVDVLWASQPPTLSRRPTKTTMTHCDTQFNQCAELKTMSTAVTVLNGSSSQTPIRSSHNVDLLH